VDHSRRQRGRKKVQARLVGLHGKYNVLQCFNWEGTSQAEKTEKFAGTKKENKSIEVLSLVHIRKNGSS
ncbi:hypothetical protein PIB30_081653, partial [Stylosanthes scabra]|nr:hypothetical protein [Stylosanthes scabra]